MTDNGWVALYGISFLLLISFLGWIISDHYRGFYKGQLKWMTECLEKENDSLKKQNLYLTQQKMDLEKTVSRIQEALTTRGEE